MSQFGAGSADSTDRESDRLAGSAVGLREPILGDKGNSHIAGDPFRAGPAICTTTLTDLKGSDVEKPRLRSQKQV